ncbi:hypothetical protein H2203_004968 [Taxawa tesnikishii (nom. ined.)]|nr:hypothetical protein H2203_004968 [Dothideales sp. JES 119]
MSNRVVTGAGVTVAAALGYYLYAGGGDPKVAEKKFEHDVSKVYSSGRGNDAEGKAKEWKTEAKVLGQQAGSQIDNAVAQVKAKTSDIDTKLEAYRADAEKKIENYSHDANKQFNQAVNNFDKTVMDKVHEAEAKVQDAKKEAKSTWGSWFGGK